MATHRPASLSIHPRATSGGPKVNTTKPRRQRTATDAHRRHVEEHPTDAMSAARLSKLDSGKA